MRSVFAAAFGVTALVALGAGPAWAGGGVIVTQTQTATATAMSAQYLVYLPAIILVGIPLLLVLTLAQGLLMLSASRATRRALALAENRAAAADRAVADFKREQRPLVLMKVLTLEPFSPGAERYAVNDESYLKSICGEIWNDGTAAGSVLAVRIQSKLASVIGEPLPADENGAVLHGRKPLAMGEVWAPERPLQAAWLNASFDKHVLTLFAWGWVLYADAHGVTRRSGFAFEYVPAGEGMNGGAFRPCGPSSYWFDVEDARAESNSR